MEGFPLKLFMVSSGLFQSCAESVKKLESTFTQLESFNEPALIY